MLVPVSAPRLAVTVVLPDVLVDANPKLLIVATAVVLELQVTESLISH